MLLVQVKVMWNMCSVVENCVAKVLGDVRWGSSSVCIHTISDLQYIRCYVVFDRLIK